MKSDNSCPFLNQDQLCSIQLKMGEDYLSHTCQTYPRIFHTIDGVVEKSATLSCPEAARLALLNPEKMSFLQKDELLNHKWHTGSNFTPLDPVYTDRFEKYFWDLRVFTIQVLQSREYKLWERLVILGVFFHTVQECIEKKQIDEIPVFSEEYKRGIEQGAFDKVLLEIPANEQIQLTLLAQLLKIKRDIGGFQKRFAEYYLTFHEGICPEEEVTNDMILKKYRSCLDQFYSPFMETHEYMLEHYLVNYVFKNMFPFGKDVYDKFMLMIIQYSLLKILLIGLAGHYKELFSKEHVVGFISAFAKTIEHNHVFLEEITEYTRKSGYHTLSSMLILLKN